MKSVKLCVLDDKDMERATALKTLGVPISAGKIIVYLSGKTKGCTSPEIEHGTGMPSSSVSGAMVYLTRRGWIDDSKYVRSHSLGRPNKTYWLSIPFSEIVSMLEAEARDTFNKMVAATDYLRGEP